MAIIGFDDIVLEKKVLGYEINNPLLFKPIDPDFFAFAIHRKAQGVLNDFYKQNASSPTLEALSGFTNETDVLLFFQDVGHFTIDVSAFHLYMDQLFEMFINRQLLEDVKYVAQGLSTKKSGSELSQYLIKQVSSIRHPLRGGTTVEGFVHERAREYFENYINIEKNPSKYFTRLPFGISAFDITMNGGMDLNELTMIYGDTNSGKTMLMSNLAYNMAVLKCHVIYISIEMDFRSISTTWFARASLLDSKTIERARLLPDARKKFRETLQYIEQSGDLPYLIHSPGDSVTTDTKRAIISYRNKFGVNPDIVFLDYAGITYPMHEYNNTSERFDLVFKELKEIAGEEHTRIFTALQQSRTGKQKKKEADYGLDDIGRSNYASSHCDFVFKIAKEGLESLAGLLNIYPQKSRKGIELTKIPLTAIWNKGFIGDMNMVVPHYKVKSELEKMIAVMSTKKEQIAIPQQLSVFEQPQTPSIPFENSTDTTTLDIDLPNS